jgi:diguanylate cyclase (GGDEF)-like protein
VEHNVPAVAGGTARPERPPLPARAQYLIVGLLGCVGIALTASFSAEGVPKDWGTFALLVGFVLAADRLELYAGRFYDMRIATMPMVAAALLLPPTLVLFCGLAFAGHRLGSHLLWRQRLFNGCNHALSGLGAWAVGRALLAGHELAGTRLAVAGIATTVVYILAAWGFLIVILHLSRDLAASDLQQQLPALLAAEFGLGALGIVVAGLWESERVLVPFAILPLVLIWTSLKVSELRLEASVDAKTGLYNARHLREQLTAEIERAGRYDRPLSLFVADLDFLREVNNKYGHLAGDAVLEGIGDVLRAELRATDVAARFGGEEFVILLPETPVARAIQVAERVREAVERRDFECGRGLGSVNVTISIGVAAFPADASTAEDLLDAADAAVYAAKARGRNRVEAAAEQALAI